MRVRPVRRADIAVWTRIRRADADWLAPWEAVPPPGRPAGSHVTRAAVVRVVRGLRREQRAGRTLPLAIEYGGGFAGLVTVSGITHGALRSGSLGYWVSRRFAGRGVAPVASALAVDHCFTALGLHRLEMDVRPENSASLRVAAKLGFREEGLRRGLLFVDGAWRDHLLYGLTAEEARGGVLGRVAPAQPPPVAGSR